MGQRLALADAAVTREVIETKRPTVVGSLRDPRLTPAVHEINRDYELKSWATLPLIVKDRVIGTVELVESGAERTFTQAELDTAAAICNAAALAIENAGLFEREQQAARETRLLNDIASRTAASLDLEEVVKAATDELGQLMSFDEYGLLLLEGATVGKVIGSRPQAEALLGVSIDDFDPGFVERIASEGVLVVTAAGRPAGPGRLAGPRGPHVQRHHRPAVRDRPARRARPEQRRPGRVLGRGPPPAGARRHPALPGHQERPAVRRDQGDAPGQPQGPQLGAQREGLLHAGPRRARRRLHGDARPAARLDGRRARAARGGRLPPRHRQDQHLRPRPAQAQPPQPAGVGADARAPGGERGHHPPAVPRRVRGGRAPPPRALRRDGLPGRPRRRGHPADRARHGRGGRLRRHVVPAAVQGRAHLLAVPRRAAGLPRHPVRPRDGGRVPARAGGHRPAARPARARSPRRPPSASAARATPPSSPWTTRTATPTTRSRPCSARSGTPTRRRGSSPPTRRSRSATSSASTPRRRRARSRTSATRSSPTRSSRRSCTASGRR